MPNCMAKNSTQTGEIGKRDCVIRYPDGKYVYVYFGARFTPVDGPNEATRFSESKAKKFIEDNTSEAYDKTTGKVLTEDEEVFWKHSKIAFRADPRYTIERVKTVIVEKVA